MGASSFKKNSTKELLSTISDVDHYRDLAIEVSNQAEEHVGMCRMYTNMYPMQVCMNNVVYVCIV